MKIYEFLNNNPESRKIFGKKEIEIIKKQEHGIRLTQSEKNRLSRDIRKKFNFINLISKQSFNFDLKKNSWTNEKIKNMKRILLSGKYANEIKKIYLYGSTIENLRTPNSDIDLAVELEEKNKKDYAKFEIEFNFDKEIDLKNFSTLPEKIKKEILAKGKIIYERKNN